MTSDADGRTASRTVLRAVLRGRPTAADLVDGAFVLGLGLLALWGFRTSFDSPRFMLVGAVGLILGLLLAHVSNVLGQPWITTAVLSIAGFFAFGSAVALHRDALAGILPDGRVLKILAATPVTGWKDLLTTLPPLDGSGQLLVLPYVVGLVVGVVTLSWARRTPSAAWPVIVPWGAFGLIVLIGTFEPAAARLDGVGLTVTSFVWVVLRARRRVNVIGTGSGTRSQVLTGAALLTLASMAGVAVVDAGLASPRTPRTVLRQVVEPPFDVAELPSPLVGFRKYTQRAPQQLWDKPLLTVSDAEPGARLRISVMDYYAGTVWSAADPTSATGSNFRTVGSTIATDPRDGDADTEHVSIRIETAYAAQPDLAAWVPGLGSASSIEFEGADARVLAGSLRYNTDTDQAVVASPLTAGTTILLDERAVQLASAPGMTPGRDVRADTPSSPAVTEATTKWATGETTAWARLSSVATAMSTTGAYSDGTDPGEARYLPGHSMGRTNLFLSGPQPVGNDEQYASTFALSANHLGFPARVVLGAVIPEDGVVRGRDIHAWVEVEAANGQWYAVPHTAFMPDRAKHPDKKPPPPRTSPTSPNVPPPNPARPPGALEPLNDTVPAVPASGTHTEGTLPVWLWRVARYVGFATSGVLAVIAVIALAHGLRRRRRRASGPLSRRLSMGWTDLVDRARDLGNKVPPGLTRAEQASLIGHPVLATEADRAVFGAEDPSAEEVADYWSRVAEGRKVMTRDASLRRRVLLLFSIRSMLFRDPRPVEHVTRATRTPQNAIKNRLAIARTDA